MDDVNTMTGEVMPVTAGDLIRSGDTIQQTKTTYHTAVSVQRPRDIVEVRDKCRKEAEMAGDLVYYGWGLKGQSSGKSVEGLSIGGAMIAMRNWKNCAVETAPIVEDERAYYIKSYFIDLENGVSYSRTYRLDKSLINDMKGNMTKERKRDALFAIGISKSNRNVIIKALPQYLIEEIIETGKKSAIKQIDEYIKKNGIEKAKDKMEEGLKKAGVDLPRMESYLGTKKKDWKAVDIAELKNALKAIQSGEGSAEEIFPQLEPDKPKDTKGADNLADKLKGKKKGKPESKPEPETEDKPEPEPKPEPEDKQPDQEPEQPGLPLDDEDDEEF